MGKFFSAVHIQNRGKSSKEEFIKSFNDAMNISGLEPCDEDDASVSYILAFSENNQWVTLTSMDYNDNMSQISEDAKQVAAALKTNCFTTNVVDSDFAIMELYKETSSISDTLIVGDGSGYGMEEEVSVSDKREFWEPLLAEEKTWDEFTDIFTEDAVFVEDTLGDIGSLLGIDPINMASDYEDFSDKLSSTTNIVEVHFQ